MKKILCVILVAVLMLGVTACGLTEAEITDPVSTSDNVSEVSKMQGSETTTSQQTTTTTEAAAFTPPQKIKYSDGTVFKAKGTFGYIYENKGAGWQIELPESFFVHGNVCAGFSEHGVSLYYAYKKTFRHIYTAGESEAFIFG